MNTRERWPERSCEAGRLRGRTGRSSVGDRRNRRLFRRVHFRHARLAPRVEEYSETIFELEEDDIRVVQARIAERLNVSRPAVSEMVHRMAREGLLVIKAGTISLTDEGRTLGQTTVRRHRLAERFLTDILGLSWAAAHHEAGKWEHVISPVVESAMIRVLGDPTTCPHGNPIPGSAYAETDAVPLSNLGVGDAFVVERIPEELEFEADCSTT